MKNGPTVKINGVEKEVSFALLGSEEVTIAAKGLIADPENYKVTYKRLDGSEGTLLPSEKMYPEEGMEFTVSRR